MKDWIPALNLIATILVALMMIRLHLLLRKEKFKEIFYKEKITSYKALSEKLWDLYAVCVDVIFKKADDVYVQNELLGQLAKLSEHLGRNFFIAKAVDKKTREFINEVLRLHLNFSENTAEKIDFIKVQSAIADAHIAAINAIRKDIGTDLVTKQIYETLEFGKGRCA